MRLLRSHRSIVVFLVIALIAVTYGAISYVNIPRLLGIGRFPVTIDLPVGAGLYPNSIVTLRGVKVGQVDSIHLTPTGAAAEIQIDNGTVIPASSDVEVRSTSAVGEQYINFEPRSAAGPVLADSATVPASRVAIPIATADLLQRVNTLVATVPKDDLQRTITAVSRSFGGAGGDLQRLLDSGSSLQREASANLDPTLALIHDLQPVLATQQRQAGNTRTLARDLASFTDTLRTSDADLRGTLEHFPPFLDTFNDTLNGLRPSLPTLLGNLTSVGQVVRVYLPDLAQTVTILQPTLNVSIATLANATAPNAIKIDFRAQVNAPPPCTTGFLPDRRSPSDLSPAPPATNAYCQVPHDSPLAVRGARNDLCPPGSPMPDARGNTARQCGLNFQTPEEEAAQRAKNIARQLDQAAENPRSAADDPDRPPQFPAGGSNQQPQGQAAAAPADPSTGLFSAPGVAGLHILGNATAPTATGWQGFLLNPLGVGAITPGGPR